MAMVWLDEVARSSTIALLAIMAVVMTRDFRRVPLARAAIPFFLTIAAHLALTSPDYAGVQGLDFVLQVAALAAPGVIEQTGTHRRIIFGEVFGVLPQITERVRAIEAALGAADVQVQAVADGRIPIWEKFIFLVALAGFTGAARLPIGPIWQDSWCRAQFLDGAREVEKVARAAGVPVAADVITITT